MQTPYDFGATTERMVYVKPIAVKDLPREVREQAEGHDQLFAVHDEDGQQLALVADERMAYVLARQHDYSPQPLH